MSEPIVFMSHSRVKDGMLGAFRELSSEVFPMMEASKPGTLLHYGYTDEDESEIAFIHLFLDADAMDAHFAGAGDRANRAAEYIETYRFEVYGTASEQTLAALERTPEVELVVSPKAFGGYARLHPA